MEDVVDEVLDAPNSDNEESSDTASAKNKEDAFETIVSEAKGENGEKAKGNVTTNDAEEKICELENSIKEKMVDCNQLQTMPTLTNTNSPNDGKEPNVHASPNTSDKTKCVIENNIERSKKADVITQKGDNDIKNGQKVGQAMIPDIGTKKTKTESGKNMQSNFLESVSVISKCSSYFRGAFMTFFLLQ